MAVDWLELQRTAARGFTERLAQVTDWKAPTPDTEWDIAKLVEHMIDEQRWIPPLLAGMTIAEAEASLAPIGDDLRAEWSRYAESATTAWAATAPDASVHLSYGVVPCHNYLKQQVADIAIHTWDLARGVGGDDRLDPDLVAAVWADLQPQKDMLAASGLFADPVPVPDDAPLQDRLLALTGRDPRGDTS
ncbi:TIGR03086 family metal-binding protein [Rhodococcus sp. HM1]|uniref:TIGR03086 family metal-binding protein n=1 Tax=unclassified Rhodococcus (in: high G+C Gram-positive bacteria) TaxID=192944 RepID=UPI0018CEBD01|nr:MULTISPECIES: TIGR03086 family metal-binding protein [unclassified Rhodococcus (in: high G+C Gram-positive bacteria)]MBH0123468.1 TIGR03086 family protein [Rhodococcus sp. CX]MCK8670456.1 TIGR03086 family metal-binding protein [Rhodococcus sp. HM1]